MSVFRQGDRCELDREIRARFKDLAEMPHMREELRALFTILAQPLVETETVLSVATATLAALRDVEAAVARQLERAR